MKVDPWPSHATDGELDKAEREWLFTNGAGAYAMSTVALMHTRRYHGLLVAALEPPLSRHVILSHMETSVLLGSRTYRLSTHQFPNTAPTPGYRLLRHFYQDPLPRWRYRLKGGYLERTLCLPRGENAVIFEFCWHGDSAAILSTRPLLPMRPNHQFAQEHGGIAQRVSLTSNTVQVQPVAELPPVFFEHSGVFIGSPDWWRRFEYTEDRLRGVQFQEDMWTPGTFEVRLEPGEKRYLTVAVGALPTGGPAEIMERTRRYWLGIDPGTAHSLTSRSLCVAAEHFRLDDCPRPGIIAGYPWLAFSTRDALISLPGLYLAPGYLQRGKRVVEGLLELCEAGLLRDGLREDGQPSEGVCADGTLWLFEAARQLRIHLDAGDPFVSDVVYPVLLQIFERVVRGPKHTLWLNDAGLVVAAGSDVPLTWMDSRAHGQLVTPRYGAPIELQSLWSSGMRTLAAIASERGDRVVAQEALESCERTRMAFKRHFWCEATGYPYDVVAAAEVESSDCDLFDAVRPNALIALSLDPLLFERWQVEAILDRVRLCLLTPHGVRTLDPEHPRYIGHYEGPMAARKAAYHQGVVWVYLLGSYARAALANAPDSFELQLELKHTIEALWRASPLLGQISQVASGDSPHAFGGCPAQAWSIAELLRTLLVDLSL